MTCLFQNMMSMTQQISDTPGDADTAEPTNNEEEEETAAEDLPPSRQALKYAAIMTKLKVTNTRVHL